MKDVPTKTLIEAFDYDFATGTGGIFSSFSSEPWMEGITASDIDAEYFGNRSGYKKCSTLVYHLMRKNTELKLTNLDVAKLAAIMLAKFGSNWSAIWDTFVANFNFLDDYSITEETTVHDEGSKDGSNTKSSDFERSKTDEVSYGKTNTESVTETVDSTTETTHGHAVAKSISDTQDDTTTLMHGEVITETTDETKTSSTDRYGFNSASGVPVDEISDVLDNDASTTHSGNDVTDRDFSQTKSESETHSGKDTEELDTTRGVSTSGSLGGKDTNTIGETSGEDTTTTYGETNESDRSIDRSLHGRKGNVTPQELIRQQREIFMTSFFDKVFSDMDSILTSSVYVREHIIHPYGVYPFGYINI